MKFTTKTVLSIFLLLLACPCLLFAEILSYSIDSNFSSCNNESYNKNTVKVSYVDFNYDTETEQLTIEAEFNNQGGVLANSFHFGFNSDTQLEILSGSKYKYAYFYVDGRSSAFANGNIATPKVSAFVANRQYQNANLCNNSEGSWVAEVINGTHESGSEPILANTSGYNNNPSYVAYAELSDTLESGIQKRKFTIILDGKDIQDNFIVNSLNEYLQRSQVVGCQSKTSPIEEYCRDINNKPDKIFDFGSRKQFSFDFFPSNVSWSSYNGSQLTNLSISNCSRCRTLALGSNLNTAPTCQVSTSANKILAGEALTVTYNFTDPDTSHNHIVNYTGLKSGISTTYAEGETIFSNETKTISLNWTPTVNDVGNYTFGAKLTELYGQNQLSAECSIDIEVFANTPVCTQTDIINKRETIIENTYEIDTLLRKTYKKAKKVKKNKVTEEYLDLIDNYRDETLTAMNRVPGVINNCTENIAACQQFNLLDEFKNAQLFGQTLYCKRSSTVPFCSVLGNIGKSLLKFWKNGYRKKIRKRNLSSDSRKVLRFNRQYKKYKKKLIRSANQNFELTNELLGFSTPKQHFVCE